MEKRIVPMHSSIYFHHQDQGAVLLQTIDFWTKSALVIHLAPTSERRWTWQGNPLFILHLLDAAQTKNSPAWRLR